MQFDNDNKSSIHPFLAAYPGLGGGGSRLTRNIR